MDGKRFAKACLSTVSKHRHIITNIVYIHMSQSCAIYVMSHIAFSDI